MQELPKNRFKAAIEAGDIQLGIWSNIRDSLVVEMLGDSGFDFVTIDCEHAPNDLREVVSALQALRGTGAEAAVRVPGLDPVTLKRVLDAGAQTVIVPYIQTVEEAELAAASEFDHVLVNADVEQCAEALIGSSGLSGYAERSPHGK